VNEALSNDAGAGTAGRLALAGRLTINEAEAVRDAWVGALAGCRELVIDAGDLEAVDVAGLQLLIALRRSAGRAGKTVRLAGPPAGALLAALVAAGLRSESENGAPAPGRDGFWWGRS